MTATPAPILADLARDASWVTLLVFALDWLIRIGLSVRVVMRRTGVGEALSWLTIVLLLPFAGAVIYLVLGENRLGTHRARETVRLHRAHAGSRSALRRRPTTGSPAVPDDLPPDARAIHRQAQHITELPALPGNALELISDSHEALARLAEDIDAARERCHLEFFIWSDGGAVDGVVEALVRAAERGVACRVLVDAVGGKGFFRGGRSSRRRLRAAGVEVVASLPAGLFRAVLRRLDLRNHRKLAVIDGRVAYTGSLNMIDPATFKADAGVGAWVDAMVRVEGSAAEALDLTFREDWQLETDEDLPPLTRRPARNAPPDDDGVAPEVAAAISGGGGAVQVVPSGPILHPESIHRLLIASIYAARDNVTLTTPYFVPDESLLIALTSAAARGVDTLVVLPERSDSFLVRHASSAYLGELLAAGVKVAKFRGGLLHTKSVTVDGHLSLFGTVNLDMRSFYLNFELTLLVYGRDFTRRLTSLQQSYVVQSNMARLDDWRRRPFPTRLLDNTARLLGPLL
ncbi:MAG: cardiolipin synthase [Planctomycetota bacterium]